MGVVKRLMEASELRADGPITSERMALSVHSVADYGNVVDFASVGSKWPLRNEYITAQDIIRASRERGLSVVGEHIISASDISATLDETVRLKVVERVKAQHLRTPAKFVPTTEAPRRLPPVVNLRIAENLRTVATPPHVAKYEALLRTMRGPTIAEMPRPLPPIAPALPSITIESLMEQASQPSYTEIYGIFRRRENAEDDRLLDCLTTAPTLDEAVGKVILLAGYDDMEAEGLGLNEFDAGDICALCFRLQELTGDVYEVSPFEQPHDPAQ